jgi:catalase
MAPGIADTVKEAITGSPAENAKVAAMSGNMKNYMDSNNRTHSE